MTLYTGLHYTRGHRTSHSTLGYFILEDIGHHTLPGSVYTRGHRTSHSTLGYFILEDIGHHTLHWVTLY